MKQIIKDATKGLKGEEKEKAIRDLFVKVMPKEYKVALERIANEEPMVEELTAF